jgi:SAM-dependent methyltransferase
VVDIACGTGQPSLAIAARVQPGGTVVATDVASSMLAAASRRAKESGIDNIEFVEMDAEDLRFGDAVFDAVSCACGLMFCTDPGKAVSEMRRVLVPGGRFAIAVWDEPTRSPFFALAGKALSDAGVRASSRAKAPSLAPAAQLARVLRAGGCSEFRIDARPMTFELESIEDYWTLITSFSPGLEQELAKLPARGIDGARENLRRAATDFFVGGRLRLTATPLCASGRVLG